MGLLDDLKSKANDAIAGATGKLSSLAVPGKGKGKGKNAAGPAPSGMDAINAALARGESGGSSHDNGSSGDFEGGDEYDDILNDAIKPQRSDILDLLGIPDNYEVPDEVLLAGDLDRVRFDRSSPVGYSEPMVDAFFSTVYDSLVWYHDTLKKRNRDIAKLATQLDKSATDLHNAKINAEMSDGLTVMTGQESTAEQEMQKLQLAVIKLRDENDKLKKQAQAAGGSASADVPDSRYDDLQNQLGLAQLEIKKLTAQLKRQGFENAGADEGALNLNPVMTVQGAPGTGTAPMIQAEVPAPNPFSPQAAASQMDSMPLPDAGMPAIPAAPVDGPAAPDGMGMPGPDGSGLGDGTLATPNVTRSNLTGVGTMDFTGRSNEGYSSPERSQATAAANDDEFDVDLSANGLQDGGGMPDMPSLDEGPAMPGADAGMPADMPVPDLGDLDGSPSSSLPDAGLPGIIPDLAPNAPGSNADGNGSEKKSNGTKPAPADMSSDEFLPLPDSMNPDSYDELGISLDDGSGEIDMSDML